jgi:hypothetical protein
MKHHLFRALAFLSFASVPVSAEAQWSRTYEQFYLPGNFNWTFRNEYAVADRLFNAFDYGHAILYERLYTQPDAPVRKLEVDEYDFITTKLLVRPPELPLEEAAIEIRYARMAPEAKMMFDWAHLLHRQIYDVLASEKLSQSQKDAKVAELVAYYKTRPDIAFSSLPKNMDLMEQQPYSLAFRQRYPKFNGLIWGYHWLQVGLYEPLITGRSREERQAGVTAAVARFRQMLENAPQHMPRVMPMTAAIAPTFAARYPEASIIFDNLHSMHDVVSDILANNEKVPHSRKREAILEAAARYRDSTSYLMSVAEWKSMGEMMGVQNMGGPAVGFLPGWPAPTLARGITMAEAMKNMSGMQHGESKAMAAMPGMVHGADSSSKPATLARHDTAHAAGDSAVRPGISGSPAMTELHGRMMRDPVIRERVMADTAMRRMMNAMGGAQGAMDHGAMQHDMKAMDMTHGAAPTTPRAAGSRTAPAKKPTSTRRPSKPTANSSAKKPAKAPAKPAPKPAPMDHSKMPGMKMPGMTP